jgi:hypothetical protein
VTASSSVATTAAAPIVIPLLRPRIEPARDCQGVYVLLPNGHGWLVGDRRQALWQFRELVDIERFGSRR